MKKGFVSDLKKFQRNHILYKEMFEVLVQNSPVSMYIFEDQAFSFVNNHFSTLFGYSEEELIDGFSLNHFIHPDDLHIVQDRIREAIESDEFDARYRVRVYKKDGTLIHVEIHSTKIIRYGIPVLIGTVFDVTEEVTANVLLRESKDRFKSLFFNNPDAIFTFDLQGNFIETNLSCELLTGYSTQELIHSSFVPLVIPEDLEQVFNNFEEAKQGIPKNYEVTITCKDGKQRNLEITNFPRKLEDQIIGVYGIAKDITEKIEHQKIMEDLVFFDLLTKLPNRKLFEDRLKQVFKLSEDDDNQTAVLSLNFDRFKHINDTLGHQLADEFLKIVSKRLTENVGKTDTVGRFAGDKFAVLIPNAEVEETVLLAEYLYKELAEPFELVGHSLSVSVSIGIAFSKGGGDSVESLLKKADTAMYFTKKYGEDNYTVYNDELEQKTAYKLTIERDLNTAISNREFTLHYQPIIDLKSGNLNAMESLIRWKHSELGLIPPDHFIPVSEESGQIVSIGSWVLHKACSQNKAWQDLGYPPFKVCVNISTIQLKQPDFVDKVREILNNTGLHPKWLELEVTESILLEDTNLLKESLSNLKNLGVSISIDDFGTGYTSLSYLRQFSFDKVKIDRSFIGDIGQNLNGKAITSTIISLAHKLGMEVVAEGIEDETQLSFLQAENCNEGQGYYFSKPLDSESLDLSLIPNKYL